MTGPRVRLNRRLPMPDGAELATDVYLPPGEVPVPVLLLRTPYGKGAHLQEGLGWAGQGFGFVVQDVRGRYDSGGRWEPYVHERADGANALSWVADQPWCDGSVALIGGSYGSFTAWTAALSKHPAVRAVISLVPAVGAHACYGPGGVLYLASHARWWLANGDGAVRREGLFEAMYRTAPGILAELPVQAIGHRLWADLPTWFDPVQDGPGTVPDYAVTDDELAMLDIPSLHVGGWYDGFLDRTLHQWRIAGSALPARPLRALVIGPWTHDLQTDVLPTHGERRHQAQARMPLGRRMAEWLGALLDGTVAGSRAQVYVCGAEQWVIADDWPPGRHSHTWYAGPGGGLQEQPPTQAGHDSFRYDPADPFPSRSAPVDRRDLDQRCDAVRYTSPRLTAPCEIAGSAEVILYATTDAPSTDWVARLFEVTTEGRRLHLTHGVLAVSGTDRRAHRMQLTPLAVRLPAGHRICLEITSSDFPDYARNLNTGLDRYTTSMMRVAEQAVHRGPDRPTALILPVPGP